MQTHLTISKQSPAFPDYLDFQTLRALGIEHLQKLSGEVWTDYNLHDPGITILEVLCYAITDLGYRNSLETRDLLAIDPRLPKKKDDNFFTPDEILTCNPVTELDIRKRLIDIQGVRNAWIQKRENTEPEIYLNRDDQKLEYAQLSDQVNRAKSAEAKRTEDRLNLRGLYSVLIDLAPEVRTNACGKSFQPWEAVVDEVKAVLHSHRNLCEDIEDIVVVGEEKIGLETNIEIAADADAETVLVEIFTQVQHFLAPYVQFYTLQSLLAKGKSTAEIFAGRPSALPKHDERSRYDNNTHKSHGFIDVDELKAYTLPTVVHTSDLYKVILNVPGVNAIKNLSIFSSINEVARSESQPWHLYLSEHYRPVLSIQLSQVSLFKQNLPIEVDANIIQRRYEQQQIVHLKAQRDAYELDLPIPKGTHYDLADHYSIHHEFPLTYGIGEVGLPESATKQRKAQAKQLKAYLLFFDQVLANYLNQLSQVRSLFSWDKHQWQQQDGQQHTYLANQRPLDFAGFKEIVQPVLQKTPSETLAEPSSEPEDSKSYPHFLQSILEDSITADARRHKLLDHLLARFAEDFTDYILVNYQLTGDTEETQRLHDKADFLQAYPTVSRDRFRAVDYTQFSHFSTPADSPPATRHISGFQQRLERLLGISSTPKTEAEDERFYLIEHILLRPKIAAILDIELLPPNFTWGATYETEQPAMVDPYSFWISVLFPSTPERYNNPSFRQLIERTVRIEAPAHVAVKIGWFNPRDMDKLKAAYNDWTQQLSIYTGRGRACALTKSTNNLIQVLSDLRSEYPTTVLANAQGETNSEKQPFKLDESTLG